MSIAKRARRRTERAIRRLEAEFDEVPVVEKEWVQPPEEYAWIEERTEAGTVGGAGAWVTNGDGEVLLVRHEGEPGWSEPAGKHEPGETLAETARRECREETGIDPAITGVLVVDRIEHVHAEDPDRPGIVRPIVTFEGEYRGGTLAPQEGEIAEVGWWGEHPDELLYDDLADYPIPADG